MLEVCGALRDEYTIHTADIVSADVSVRAYGVVELCTRRLG
jgi:hypothetical protein